MNFPEFSEKGEVICQECGKGFKVLTGTHTRKHNMTIEQYRVKYPGAPTSGKMFSLTMSHAKREIFEEKPDTVPVPSGDDSITDEVLDDEHAPTIEEIQSHIKDEDLSDFVMEDEERKTKPIPTKEVQKGFENLRDKYELYKFLQIKYPFVQNNYMVRKLLLSGHLEYEIITDMADPINKVDFEFPNAFWHNRMPYIDPHRNLKLERDGWTIVTVNERAPRVKHLQKLISKKP